MSNTTEKRKAMADSILEDILGGDGIETYGATTNTETVYALGSSSALHVMRSDEGTIIRAHIRISGFEEAHILEIHEDDFEAVDDAL